MLQCPSCKLISPDDSEYCDCGFGFPSSEHKKYFMKKEFKDKGPTRKGRVIALLLAIAALVIGWIVFSALYIF